MKSTREEKPGRVEEEDQSRIYNDGILRKTMVRGGRKLRNNLLRKYMITQESIVTGINGRICINVTIKKL